MLCPKCNKRNDDDSRFCEFCGATTQDKANINNDATKDDNFNVDKIDMQISVLKKLNEKMWYRLLKIVYILSFFVIFFFHAFEVAYDVEEIIIFLPILIIIYEIIRRSFYYVYFGTIRPK